MHRSGERSTLGLADQPFSTPAALAVGLTALAVIVLVDFFLDSESAAIVGAYVAPAFITALLANARATAVVGALAVGLAALSVSWNMGTGDSPDYWVRLAIVAACGGIAVTGAWLREQARGRAGRLELLDAVGDVADGSLPLAETLNRVVDVVVPTIGDLCMIDAVHEGRVTRIAVRARGSEDDAAVERGIRSRQPALPVWLVNNDRPWRKLPRWLPRMNDEDLKRMAQSPEDLAFLRTLGVRSSVVVPIVARDRNLGALTLVAAWSGRTYRADDVQFAEILASRIGLALDNAGLFSDLESFERRMDTVMSILDEAIVMRGPGGELVYANPAAARTLGYETSEEVLSEPLERLGERFSIRDELGRELGPEALVGDVGLAAGGSPTAVRAVDLETGTERWTRAKSKAIEGPDGEVLFTVTAIEDVTDVKRAELSQRLLARAGELTVNAGSHREMLGVASKLLVPEFADWCALSVADDDGGIETVAVAHRDPERQSRAQDLVHRYPGWIDSEGVTAAVLETGEARTLAFADDSDLRAAAGGAEHFEILRELGTASVVVAPMSVGGGRVAGAITFVNEPGSRRFGDEDVALATEVGRRFGVAYEGARLSEERRRVADALQRELLPPSLPSMPGWELATMYEPAGEVNEVGGDFYEVFPVEGGWAVVLGDVSGRGAVAASLTAEARHTIRAAGALAGDPEVGLEVLDRNLRGRRDAALCSVAVIVLPRDPAAGEAFVHLAGHPHPILIRGEEATAVGEPGPLLGVVEGASWPAYRVPFARGDQIVVFTDGVIEAQGPGGERFGSERLRRRLAGCSTPAAAVERVRSALITFGAKARQDDAAVVAIRCAGYATPATASSRTASTTSAAS